jgi:hypothetical protein
MMIKKNLLFFFVFFALLSCSVQRTGMKSKNKVMMFGDTNRLGVPFAKDPYVIRFQNRFLMYYSVPGYTDKAGVVHGWGIGIAESNDLINWKRMGEVNTDPTATY